MVGLANHTVLVARDGRGGAHRRLRRPDPRPRTGRSRGVVLVFRDVTEARRAAEARLHLAAIVESSDDAIIGKDLDGTIASWNRGGRAALRVHRRRGRRPAARRPGPARPPRRAAGDPGPAAARASAIEHFETLRVRKDGSRVDVSLTISPVRDAEGRVVGASKIARDITARKEADRRKDEFLATLAHELRNPLAPIRNGLQVMRLAGDDRRRSSRPGT